MIPEVSKLDRSNIDKIAQNQEDRILLAKLWDKINGGIRRNIPANTGFLSPREQEMARFLFGDAPGLCYFGGYPDAERKMLCYIPDYLDEETFFLDGPILCLRAVFHEGDTLSHRDFLGALMGAGIARETVGDICVDTGSCDFFVTEEIARYVESTLISAGRTKLRISTIPLCDAKIPTAQFRIINDTLASLRLDSVISAGFRISRGAASQHIVAGSCAINGLPCQKPDKLIQQGDKISMRGSGKILLASVNGQTKKGRISVEIHRYI